jgi:hypothetical protein
MAMRTAMSGAAKRLPVHVLLYVANPHIAKIVSLKNIHYCDKLHSKPESG